MTDRFSRDYSGSAAVLIGTSEYEHLSQVPAAANSLTRMHRLLVGELCGWPNERVTVVRNERKPGDLPDRLVELFSAVEDVALFYYVGHGQIYGDELVLGLVESRDAGPRRVTTGLQFADVRRALRESEAKTKIVILDCCFSGHATQPENSLSPRFVDVIDKVQGTGAFTMAASGAYRTAWFELDHDTPAPQTYFTKYLVDAIERGSPDRLDGLTLGMIYSQTADDLARDRKPEPTRSNRHDADRFVFARNATALEVSLKHEAENKRLRDQLAAAQHDAARQFESQEALHDRYDQQLRYERAKLAAVAERIPRSEQETTADKEAQDGAVSAGYKQQLEDERGRAQALLEKIAHLEAQLNASLTATDTAPAAAPTEVSPVQIDERPTPQFILPGDAYFRDPVAADLEAEARASRFAVQPSEPEPPAPAVETARNLIAQGRLDAAESALAEAFEAGDGEAGILLADLLGQRGDRRGRHALLDQAAEQILRRTGTDWRAARRALLASLRDKEQEEDIERFLRAQADIGDPDSQLQLARYLLGKGQRNHAIILLQMAAAGGNADAAELLTSTPRDVRQQAVQALEASRSSRDSDLSGSSVPLLLGRATGGNAAAAAELQDLLDRMIERKGGGQQTHPPLPTARPGAATIPPPEEAEEWLERGRYYRDKVRNWKEASLWLQRAANAGNAQAVAELRDLLARMGPR